MNSIHNLKAIGLEECYEFCKNENYPFFSMKDQHYCYCGYLNEVHNMYNRYRQSEQCAWNGMGSIVDGAEVHNVYEISNYGLSHFFNFEFLIDFLHKSPLHEQ